MPPNGEPKLDRARRLELLLRNRAGAEERGQLEKLIGSISKDITILPLERSDVLRGLLSRERGGVRLEFCGISMVVEFDRAAGELEDMARGFLNSDRVLVFFTRSAEIGVVEGGLDEVLRHAMKLVEFDGDSLTITTLDVDKGVFFDLDEDCSKREFELKQWRMVQE